jgi:hypothetical protein
MIETCSYCGAVHEVGGEDSFHGVPIKSCRIRHSLNYSLNYTVKYRTQRSVCE